MPENPYQPPKEVGTASSSWIIWLLIGCATVTLATWPCLTLAFMAGLPWEPIEAPEDHGIAVEAELLGRLVVSAAISLPLAAIAGLVAMFAGNHRRCR